MYRYQRLLVAMSLTDQDQASISYAGLVSRLANSEKVTFMHVTPSLKEIPEELQTEYPDLVEASGERAQKKMKELVSKHFPSDHKSILEYQIVEGSPLIELLRRAKEDDKDLVIMGKRLEPAEGSFLPVKLTRRLPCSVLLVPEKSEADFSNILAPSDFSENSIDAMDVAVAFASAKGIEEIYCLHAYDVPIGYYKTGKSYEQFAEIMKGHAEKNFQSFLQKEVCQIGSVCQIKDLKGIKVTPIYKLEKKAAKAIEEEINNLKIDLLVIGARGRHAGAGVLLGSVTEYQIKTTKIPILAVKKKGTGMNILDALLKL
ncbi:MAG: universal stress protein [Desulfobacterales bacterium]